VRAGEWMVFHSLWGGGLRSTSIAERLARRRHISHRLYGAQMHEPYPKVMALIEGRRASDLLGTGGGGGGGRCGVGGCEGRVSGGLG